jgi:hypothetical protein
MDPTRFCTSSWVENSFEVPAELVDIVLSPELQNGTVIADDLDGHRCISLTGL